MKKYRPARIAPKSDPDQKAPRRPAPPARLEPRKRMSAGKMILLVFLASAVVLLLQNQWVKQNKGRFGSPLVTRMFKQLDDAQHLVIQCPHCRGVGVVQGPDGDQLACPECFGLGGHHVRRYAETDVVCSECHGMGRVLDETGLSGYECPLCGGRGLVDGKEVRGIDGKPVKILQIECDECVGSGTVRNPETGRIERCPVCDGLGFNWVRKFDESERICPACGGMGRIREDDGTVHPCTRCGQRGALTAPSETADKAE